MRTRCVAALAAVLVLAGCTQAGEADTGRVAETRPVRADGADLGERLDPEPTPVARAVGVLTPRERPRRLTVLAGGDILIHQAVWESARADAGGVGYDFGPMFEPVAHHIRAADLALCHLEVPLSPDNGRLASYPRFVAPFELADAIAGAGFDGCSVASNHILDQGVSGIDATLDHLDRVGVGHAGAARSPVEAVTIRTYDVRGVRVAHLSHTYGFNGLRRPAGEEWRADLISVPAILHTAARARHEGAEVVVVSLHWGDEYVHRPNPHQLDVAAALAPSPDIDLVLGHHAHVIQPVDVVGSTPVAYGLGNLLSNMLQPERRDGVLLVVTLELRPGEPVEAVGLHAIPTQVAVPHHRIEPAPAESWQRTMQHLESLGVEVPPLGLVEVPQ